MKNLKCSYCLNKLDDGYSLAYCPYCGGSLYTDMNYSSRGMPSAEEYENFKRVNAGGYEIAEGILVNYAGEEAVVPDNVTAIADDAFVCDGYCRVKQIHLSGSVEQIEDGALMLDSLKSIEVSHENRRFKAIDGNLYSRDGTILLRYAQGKCARSFRVPNGVKAIGNYAFAFSKYLDEVILPEGLEVIGDYAFKQCLSIKKIEIPSTVHSIGNNAFEWCICLNQLTLHEGLISIGLHAFRRCGLETLILPQSVACIGGNAFEDCVHLKRVVLGKNLKYIAYKAFGNCRSLRSIYLPESVEKMSLYVFDFCDTLKDIYCEAPKKPEGWQRSWKTNVYDDGRSTCKAKVHWGYSGKDYEISQNIDDNKGKTPVNVSPETNLLQSKALKGDITAQFELAERYFYGKGVKRSCKTAFDWYKRAAEGGHVSAMTCLGYCYQFAFGTRNDYAKALNLYMRAAKLNDYRAVFLYGFCAYVGINEESAVVSEKYADVEKAVALFKIAAEKGMVAAQCWLAYLLNNGTEMEKDEEKAEKLYRAAAENGSEVAIDWCMENGVAVKAGERIVLNKLSDIKRLAAAGDAKMQLTLAEKYEKNFDNALAFSWCKKAAESGYYKAMYKLSEMYRQSQAYYEDGSPDLREHFRMAQKWLYRAAEQGYWAAIDDILNDTTRSADYQKGVSQALNDFFAELDKLPEEQKQAFFGRPYGKQYKSSADDDIAN